jgi:endonuclease-8
MAGVGNVFKSEICFVTGINPFCKVTLSLSNQAQALIAIRKGWLRPMCLKTQATRLSPMAAASAAPRMSPIPCASLWVYGRNGEPCRRCGEPIRRRIQGPDARVTFWCPRCQPMPDGTMSMDRT